MTRSIFWVMFRSCGRFGDKITISGCGGLRNNESLRTIIELYHENESNNTAATTASSDSSMMMNGCFSKRSFKTRRAATAVSSSSSLEEKLRVTTEELNDSRADTARIREEMEQHRNQVERLNAQVVSTKQLLTAEKDIAVSKLKEELTNVKANISDTDTKIFSCKQEIAEWKERYRRLQQKAQLAKKAEIQ